MRPHPLLRPNARALALALIVATTLGLAACGDKRPPVSSTTVEDDMLSNMKPSEVIRRQAEREKLEEKNKTASDDRLDVLKRRLRASQENLKLAQQRLERYANAEYLRAKQAQDARPKVNDPTNALGKQNETVDFRAACLLLLGDAKRQPAPPEPDCRHDQDSPTCGPRIAALIEHNKAALAELERVEKAVMACPSDMEAKASQNERERADQVAKFYREQREKEIAKQK